jgi:hypothetical protein
MDMHLCSHSTICVSPERPISNQSCEVHLASEVIDLYTSTDGSLEALRPFVPKSNGVLSNNHQKSKTENIQFVDLSLGVALFSVHTGKGERARRGE